MFRIVFNWSQQYRTLSHSARCRLLILRWPGARRELPKLDVTGSIPVSRSIPSMTQERERNL